MWEPLLSQKLDEVGIEHWPQYQACGFYLDFAHFVGVGKDGELARKINIEVDGETYHRDRDGNLRREDVHRDQILRAAGWTAQRFWVYELREDMDRCLRIIRALIQAA